MYINILVFSTSCHAILPADSDFNFANPMFIKVKFNLQLTFGSQFKGVFVDYIC